MKKKIEIWKRQRIIFLILGIIITVVSLYFLLKSETGLPLYPISGMILGAIIAFGCAVHLVLGYPVLQRKGFNTNQEIKTLSLFKKEEIGGVTLYVYEIEIKILNKEETFLLEDTVCLKIGDSYILTVDKKWAQK